MNATTDRVIEVKGNLLTSDCDVLFHQANCQSIMGAGIALQIKRHFPAAFAADVDFPYSVSGRFGRYSSAETHNGTKPVEVVNLYSQRFLGKSKHPSDSLPYRYAAMEMALGYYFREKSTEPDFDQLKFGVPTYMGCAIAGGDWNVVRGILQKVAERFDIVIYTYTL